MLVDAPTLSGSSVLIGLAKDKTLIQAGVLATVVGVTRWVATYAFRITSVVIRAETAPVGADLQVIVKKNGITISSTPFVIPAGQNSITVAPAGLTKTTGINGDYYTVDVIQIGSTTPGSDLSVRINHVITGA